MPLVSHNDLPTFERLRREGHVVLTPERAREQDIRALHIGLLNMMPDAAMGATERQFYRLIGSSNPISQFYLYPFTLPEIPRSQGAKDYVKTYYTSFETLQEHGLDALIITGANVTEPDLSREVYWDPLVKVIDWAEHNVTSTLCSCLSTHAVMQYQYNTQREPLQHKAWGVFQHQVVDNSHPLVHDINTRLAVPHSRFNRVSRERFEAAGLHVLIDGDAGVQMAVSADGIRQVFFQGHPEYDQISLLKEYKREIGRYIAGESTTYPPYPANYFDAFTQAVFDEYQQRVQQYLDDGQSTALPVFPEQQVLPHLDNTWHDSGEAVVGNWLGCVYQLTHADRRIPYMDNIAHQNPLGWSKLDT